MKLYRLNSNCTFPERAEVNNLINRGIIIPYKEVEEDKKEEEKAHPLFHLIRTASEYAALKHNTTIIFSFESGGLTYEGRLRIYTSGGFEIIYVNNLNQTRGKAAAFTIEHKDGKVYIKNSKTPVDVDVVEHFKKAILQELRNLRNKTSQASIENLEDLVDTYLSEEALN